MSASIKLLIISIFILFIFFQLSKQCSQLNGVCSKTSDCCRGYGCYQGHCSNECSQHLGNCGNGKCCDNLSCKRFNGKYYCSNAPCVKDGNKCQKDDGCCFGSGCVKGKCQKCDSEYVTCSSKGCCPPLKCGVIYNQCE
uniref:Uncharacterized protein n=1 Tax=Meloidogyne enterolobii TaxID=390850 RepID=A0A6V7XRJ8_MELEN|nr:unnamed protein product [Meloidogyne enterolobii]